MIRRALYLMLPLLLWAVEALARPGGGGGFSGGGGGGGGGGGSDDGIELFFDILLVVLELVVDYPQVGIPLVLVLVLAALIWIAAQSGSGARVLIGFAVVGGLVAGCIWVPYFLYVLIAVVALFAVIAVIGSFSGPKKRDWSTNKPAVKGGRTPATERGLFKRIARIDPDFSPVVFSDFVYALYAEVQRARGKGSLGQLSPYISETVRTQMKNDALTSVEDIVIASARVCDGKVKDDVSELELEFETNFTEHTRTAAQSYYHRERWTLRRLAGAKSRPPEKVSAFACPSCGAPLDPEQSSVCRMCRETIDTGRFDWRLEAVTGLDRSEKGPMLTAEVEERGTDNPTVIDNRLSEASQQLKARDPDFDMQGFLRRVHLVFATFQTAWSQRDLKAMRPFLSDRLFVAQQYWVSAYKAADLRNVNKNARITRLEPARMTSDKYFDAVTVRVYASGLDYTIDGQGKLVTGSRVKERDYSEYWTFIRSAEKRGAAGDSLACPNCGKPLDINMAGTCSACDTKITTGRFDWVLSRIEQDDTYQG